MSQAALGKLAGVDKSSLSKFETAETLEFNVAAFFAICEVLDVDPMTVWYGEPRKKSGK